jgi:hypothetical protein
MALFERSAMSRMLILSLMLTTASVVAQVPQDSSMAKRLAALEEAQQALQLELQKTRQANESMADEISTLRKEREEADESVRAEIMETSISALASSLEEANWSKATKSGLAIRFYGFVRLDAY